MLFGATGGVVILSALTSGILDRRGVSLVPFFLAFGLVLGPYGFGLIEFTLDSSILRAAAALALTMVLFSDAVTVRPEEVRSHAGLAALILGPGTLCAAALIALAAWRLLDFSGPSAAMLGAALASTDPVMLRPILRNSEIPIRVRQPLELESSLNDAVLLPIVLIAMTIATGNHGSVFAWIESIALGPIIGVLVGIGCVLLLQRVRERFGIRHEYESLYALGIALTAFVAAEAIHASGYLAAVSAGLAIAFRDVELCDCFRDYGEATAEIGMLLTFVALGTSLIWTGLEIVSGSALFFVAVALVARPIGLLLFLRGQGLSSHHLQLLAWFGPRGLSSLLLCLLPVFAGVPGAERIFAACSLVTLFSILLHGISPAFLNIGSSSKPTGQEFGTCPTHETTGHNA